MKYPSIPHPRDPNSVIVRMPRHLVTGASEAEAELKDEFSPLALKALERELDGVEVREHFKSIMSGLHVEIAEFDAD
jgi:hypothetical protein